MNKIESLKIEGIRGIKKSLDIPLNSKSILIYGDNASGKSSLVDAIEWFYLDKVEHLSSDEIDRKGGLTAIRNVYLDSQAEGLIEIGFKNNQLNSKKSVKNDLVIEYANKTPDFSNYLTKSSNENLILRYQNLVNFILATKSEKLKTLSEIIGFSEVTNLKELLKKLSNKFSKEIKSYNYENLISSKERTLLENLGATINNEDQLIKKFNELLKPFNKEAKDLEEIETILKELKSPNDSALINEKRFIEKAIDISVFVKDQCQKIIVEYNLYLEDFNKIIKNKDKFSAIALENLLREGERVLAVFDEEDKCPLCLLEIEKDKLLANIKSRIQLLKKIKDEKDKIIESGSLVIKSINIILDKISALHCETEIDKPEYDLVKTTMSNISTELRVIVTAINQAFSKGLQITNNFILNELALKDQIDKLAEKKEHINKGISNDKSDAVVKISISSIAFKEKRELLTKLEKAKKIVKSFEILSDEFAKVQKNELNSFLTSFSTTINQHFYELTADPNVSEICFIPLEKNDELTGITIEYKFNNKKESPPQKYLSESRMNCLGIAFFLTSVQAFNKTNKFFVLDDVISSFDSTHRANFSRLLIEKFSEYQILMLTHEKSWFEYTQNLVKQKNWLLLQLKWHANDGTIKDEAPKSLKERIIENLLSSDTDNLGNDIRKYLEHILKDISVKLEVRVKFLFNDRNEERMAPELLTELKSKISDYSSDKLVFNQIIDRLIGSNFFGNKDSHDNSFVPKIDDLKVFWKDVCDLENLFYCSKCKQYIATKHFDSVLKKIRCSCKDLGGLNYNWK